MWIKLKEIMYREISDFLILLLVSQAMNTCMQDFDYGGAVKLQKELKQQPLILVLESSKDFDCAAAWK